MSGWPTNGELTICFAHVAYQMAATFARRGQPFSYFQVNSLEQLLSRIGEADVLVVSGLWRNELLVHTERLRFIQAIGAGYDQFPLDDLRRRGIRLASARGVNRNAVSEHGMAFILALARQLHTGRDHQRREFWRQMISQIDQREDELGGKTLLIIGLGGIGGRLAKLAKAFEMRVIGVKRDPTRGAGVADEVYRPDRLAELLPRADYVALTCPLTPQTERIIDATALSQMKRSAYLVNLARGRCVDETALIAALTAGQIAGAALDAFWEEPLPPGSPLWQMENVLLTPHTAGETRRYEENVIDILLENLTRLARGERELVNQVV